MNEQSTRTRYCHAFAFLIVGTILLQFPPLTHRVIGVALIVIGTLKIVQNDLVERHLVFGYGSNTTSDASVNAEDS